MSKHTSLGDIALPVGAYEHKGQKKKRYRNIGELMETTEEDGSRHHWLKLNADIFHASLFALSSLHREKGNDEVIATVFAPRDQEDQRQKENAAPEDESQPY